MKTSHIGNGWFHDFKQFLCLSSLLTLLLCSCLGASAHCLLRHELFLLHLWPLLVYSEAARVSEPSKELFEPVQRGSRASRGAWWADLGQIFLLKLIQICKVL